MQPLVFFSIVSGNYLAYAITLMQSLAAWHPDSKRYLCLVDDGAGDPALKTDLFETVTIDLLGLPDFDAFVFRYDITELNTAVKPYMFEWLRARHPEAGLVYLDPDILVLRPLDDVARLFAHDALAVLTPHLNTPLPDDGKYPTELSLMRTGVYNCGFVAINAAHHGSADLIAWWARKLEFDCFIDLSAGLFTDQKWMDMAPALFSDVRILRHDGFNVAYWNLISRKIACDSDGCYTSNGVPLVFVHFSGVNISKPKVYSKHQNRFDADDLGALRPLYDGYLDKLRVNQHARYAVQRYAYGYFADGEKIVPILRRTYHRHFDVCGTTPEPHPQRMDRARFNEASGELPEIAGLPISHVMYEVWRSRQSLRESFNLNSEVGRQDYIQWYLSAGAADDGLGEAYVLPIRARFKPKVRRSRVSLRTRASAAVLRVFIRGKQHPGVMRLYARVPLAWRLAFRQRLNAAAGMPMVPPPFQAVGQRASRAKRLQALIRPGANLLGYARGEFGIGENVRSYARALEAAGHPFAIFNMDAGAVSRQQDHSMDRYFSDTLSYGNNVFFINADQMQIARNALGSEAFAGHRNIGYWLWELESFPRAWRGAFKLVDEVWAPTEFVRRAISACTEKPVLRMPKAIEFQVPSGMDRSHFWLPPDAFVFLFSFDFNGFVSRKNPEAVIAAFRQAFPDGRRDVRLLVKSTNGVRFQKALTALQQSVADDSRIEVRDGFLPRDEMFALQNAIDCYVSLHRAEGFGLGMAECMYLGKPVIATGYSGNLDFMTCTNSLLVDFNMVPLRKGDYPYWQGQRWADPEVAHAARLMRQVYDDRAFARLIGATAAASIRRTNSQTHCSAEVVARLGAIDQSQSTN